VSSTVAVHSPGCSATNLLQLDSEGNEVDTQVGRHSVSTLLIGNLPGGGNVMRGMIGEAALWRRALDPEEVAWIAAHEF
jgi:hypothetical protein